MDAAPNAIVEIVKGLRPTGLWFGSLGVLMGVFAYCYRDAGFAGWPQPFRCLAWTYLGAAVLAVPHLHLTAWALEKTAEAVKEKAENRSPLAPPVLVGKQPGGPAAAPLVPKRKRVLEDFID